MQRPNKKHARISTKTRPTRKNQAFFYCTLTQDKRTRQFTVTRDRDRSWLAHPTVNPPTPSPPTRPIHLTAVSSFSSNVGVPAKLPLSRTNQLQGQQPLTSVELWITTTTTTPPTHEATIVIQCVRERHHGTRWALLGSGKASASNAGKLCGCVLAPIYLKALVGVCVVCVLQNACKALAGFFASNEETVVGVLAGFFLGSAAQNGSVKMKNL